MKKYTANLFELANDAILIADANDQILDVNQKMCELMGYSYDEMLTLTISDLQAPEVRQEPGNIFKSEFQQYGIDVFEATNIHRDGTRISIEIRVTRIENSQGCFYFSVIRDIRNSKKQQAALQRDVDDSVRKQKLMLALSHAATALHQSQTTDDVYKSIGDEVNKLGFKAYVFCLQTGGEILELHFRGSAIGVSKEVSEAVGVSTDTFAFKIKPGGIHERVVKAGETLFLDTMVEPLMEALPELSVERIEQVAKLVGWGPAIFTPIISREAGDKTGILVVIGSTLLESDVPVFLTFARQASMALDNTQLIQRLRQNEKRMKSLSQHILYAQEQERRQIGLELHDEIGQQLLSLCLLINQSAELSSNLAMQQKIADARRICHRLEDQVSHLSLRLRPVALDEFGLSKALATLFSESDLDIDYKAEWLDHRRFAQDVELVAYRVIQEAVTNALRYADAENISVRIWYETDQLWLQVMDDGCGFDLKQAVKGHNSLGILGMYERISFVHGHLEIETTPGEGTYVSARIPTRRGNQ